MKVVPIVMYQAVSGEDISIEKPPTSSQSDFWKKHPGETEEKIAYAGLQAKL